METKEFKIQVPEGYEIDKEKSTFEKIVFKKVENKLPKSWEELGEIKGWYVDSFSDLMPWGEGISNKEDDKNIFPTKEEAEACLALAQLCQLRDRYNDGWKPDWERDSQVKWCIEMEGCNVIRNRYYSINRILAFKSEQLRDKFLENFRDLIETAKPLL
jgi:hypothetical protein|nr:MAG TPA: hypothetical protein [Caudoviricetes sp.]